MKLRPLPQAKVLRGKRVLIRVDFNVPFKNGRIYEDGVFRITQALPTIQHLQSIGAKVIIMSHLGRPNGKPNKSESLAPVAKYLSKVIGTKVLFNGEIFGAKMQRLVETMKDGQIALLENLRFDPGEEKNDSKFAKELAALADFYINDAFAVCHRAHASVAAIQKLLPSFAGFLLQKEVGELTRVMNRPRHPFVLVLGGVKMETKVGLLKILGPLAQYVLLGGALATTFLAAQGLNVGQSVYEKDSFSEARKIMKKFGSKIILPNDVLVTTAKSKSRPKLIAVSKLSNNEIIVDVGEKTLAEFAQAIKTARTIVWNGPLGQAEINSRAQGTFKIAKTIARAKKADSIIGGGDTLPVASRLNLLDQFSFASTGGGAMLDFLSGRTLPGIKPLII